MASSLLPCGECRRHVRTSERCCPFCGVALSFPEPVAEFRLLTRLDRGRLMALGAALSAAGVLTACQEPGVSAPAKSPDSPSTATEAPPATVVEPRPDVVEAPPAQPEPSTPSPAEPKAPPPPEPTTSARPNPEPGAPAAAYGGPPRIPTPGTGPTVP